MVIYMKKIILLLMMIFVLITVRVFNISVKAHDYYKKILDNKTDIEVLGLSAPRGRILDKNGNVLVDNIGINTIVYNKNKLTKKEEIELAYILADNLSKIKEGNDFELKKFYLAKNDDGNNLIRKREYELYNERKLTNSELNKMKYERVSDKELKKFSIRDKRAAKIYYLMNKGYSYDKKIILKNVSDEEFAKVIEMNLKGITGELSWIRKYNYKDTLKDIFGNIGSISLENKEHYNNGNYKLTDTVGISALEYQYDKYLQGKKAVYKLNGNGKLSKIKESKRGNDIYLSIDINMENGINEIIKKQIINGKKMANTKYYNGSYVLVLDSKTGKIVAMSGERLLDNSLDNFIDSSFNIFNSSFTPGSVVKGASMTVGYQNNLIDIGKNIKDSCVKLYLNPEKCSYKSLGYIDDITALKTSSNYYQFLLAIKSTGNSYKYNMKLDVSPDNFNLYRNTFKEYGLGNITGIDLPNEPTGLKGKKIAGDLLLNLSIGQYDTYTILELAQYMNTIANNGERYKLNLVDHIEDENHNIVYKYEKEILNKINLDEYYYGRIKEGFRQVLFLGTGYGYTNTKYNPAGKTGTSESFLDIDNDGVNDVKTITSTYAMFAPYDNPKYTIVVVSPNIGYYKDNTGYMAYINRFISDEITTLIFDKY
ncbi:MAG: penicillin-binding protein 2 [Firmicutes bacterium]|nr:penicillin-binding protein 2 [Bacillota bacterium]